MRFNKVILRFITWGLMAIFSEASLSEEAIVNPKSGLAQVERLEQFLKMEISYTEKFSDIVDELDRSSLGADARLKLNEVVSKYIYSLRAKSGPSFR